MSLLDITVSPWISIVISSISLSASLLVAYISNFKRSRPGVLIGSQITMYPAPYQSAEGVVWGGTGIYIPMTFFNWSPNGGPFILECRITIARADNPNDVFDMGWSEFAEMMQSERRMGNAGFAQPLPLPPKSSTTKTILFTWLPFSNKNLTISQGRYSLTVYIWTKPDLKPTIKETFQFNISEQEAKDFDISLKNKIGLTIDVSIRETNRQNSVLTSDQVSRIYN